MHAAHQQLSAFLLNDICLLPDVLQVLLYNLLVLVVHPQSERMDVFTCGLVLRNDWRCALADVMSPQHRNPHVLVSQGFIVSQSKDWLC